MISSYSTDKLLSTYPVKQAMDHAWKDGFDCGQKTNGKLQTLSEELEKLKEYAIILRSELDGAQAELSIVSNSLTDVENLLDSLELP